MSAGPLVGTEFAGYRVEAVIGRGGMSTVYRAQHPRLGSNVALKVLAPQLSEDEAFRERFVRESRLAASISHPNVIPIHDAGYEGDVLFIVMRYVGGSDLRHLVARHGPLSLADAARIVGQACHGLAAAHDHELVHRDVKPANLLLEMTDGEVATAHVYVADFGLSKDIGSLSRTSTASSGTVDYMSPEQIEGGTVDRRTDVYSLGCVLYECLTGMPPFAKESVAATLWAQMQEDPEPVTARRADVPSEVDGIIANAMAKQPDDRYPSCAELARDLDAAAAGSPVHTARPRAAAGKAPRRRWGLLVGAVLALVAIAAVAAGAAAMLTSGGDGGSAVSSTPPVSTQQQPPSLQRMLKQAGLLGCPVPKEMTGTSGERVVCSQPTPAVSVLTVARYRDEHWTPLQRIYGDHVRYYMGNDPNLRAKNSGRCGPKPEQWEHEDAWRINAPQLTVPFNSFDMKWPTVAGRVMCWTGPNDQPRLEWTLIAPGGHLFGTAFGRGGGANAQRRLYLWWSHIRDDLTPTSATD